MMRDVLVLGMFLASAGCSGAEAASEPQSAESDDSATVFEPLEDTLESAEGIQRTKDERADEQRRRIEAAEQ